MVLYNTGFLHRMPPAVSTLAFLINGTSIPQQIKEYQNSNTAFVQMKYMETTLHMCMLQIAMVARMLSAEF